MRRNDIESISGFTLIEKNPVAFDDANAIAFPAEFEACTITPEIGSPVSASEMLPLNSSGSDAAEVDIIPRMKAIMKNMRPLISSNRVQDIQKGDQWGRRHPSRGCPTHR